MNVVHLWSWPYYHIGYACVFTTMQVEHIQILTKFSRPLNGSCPKKSLVFIFRNTNKKTNYFLQRILYFYMIQYWPLIKNVIIVTQLLNKGFTLLRLYRQAKALEKIWVFLGWVVVLERTTWSCVWQPYSIIQECYNLTVFVTGCC